MLAVRPKTFSVDDACTRTPWKPPCVEKPEPLVVPSRTPAREAPRARPSMKLEAPMVARVSLVTTATATEAPTPTKPAPIPAAIDSSLESWAARTATVLPADRTTPLSVVAWVWVSRTVTSAVAATPTVPPPAATATATTLSLPAALTVMSPRALTMLPVPTVASVVR